MSRARMTMRAVIERNTESGTDEYSHPLPPVFATLHAALPCWVWSTSRRTVVDGDKTAIVEDVRALFPRAADVAEGDQVASIKRSEEHTSELQSLMRISYAVFCLKKKK